MLRYYLLSYLVYCRGKRYQVPGMVYKYLQRSRSCFCLTGSIRLGMICGDGTFADSSPNPDSIPPHNDTQRQWRASSAPSSDKPALPFATKVRPPNHPLVIVVWYILKLTSWELLLIRLYVYFQPTGMTFPLSPTNGNDWMSFPLATTNGNVSHSHWLQRE